MMMDESNHHSVRLGLQSVLLTELCCCLFLLRVSCLLYSAEMDTEELEKELDSLLQDSAKEPLVSQSMPKPPMSDAELEAELEKLSVSDGGMDGSKWC